MKILVLNAGSSSLKFQLFLFDKSSETTTTDDYQLLATGLIEQIGEAQSAVHLNCQNKMTDKMPPAKVNDHSAALELMIQLLKQAKCVQSLSELSGIGHRVVHGGEAFSNPVIIDQQVVNTIEQLIPLAPLHNPANLKGIKLARLRAPNIIQVAVFDTAFHQTLPEQAYHYALPYSLYTDHKVRRYGFHGTSHHYVAKQASAYLSEKFPQHSRQLKLISIHLGNGASICAIHHGQSIDTSMGMTPLEGLVMGTRSGDIDPAILFYLQQEMNMTMAELNTMLNKQSGLKGICEQNDMRTIIKLSEQGDQRAQLAIYIFCYRIKKYIGAYLAALNGADAIIFTGGIGENSPLIRQLVCSNLNNLGISIEPAKNDSSMETLIAIEAPSSQVKILVIATNEELEIARQTIHLVKNKSI